jgi:drug/metabolite transporter (DMT)-like permease
VKGWALAAIVVANIIGGSTYLGQKLALRGLPPATIILLRNLLAMVCLWFWARPSGGLLLAFRRRDHVRLALAGTLAFGAPLILGIVGVGWSTAGNGSILILLEPVSIVFFTWLLLHERIHVAQVLGLTAGLAGALIIVLGGTEVADADLLSGAHLKGNLVLALHGILWGLYSPLIAPLAQRYRSQDVTFATMAWALALLIPASLWEVPQWRGGAGAAAGPGLDRGAGRHRVLRRNPVVGLVPAAALAGDRRALRLPAAAGGRAGRSARAGRAAQRAGAGGRGAHRHRRAAGHPGDAAGRRSAGLRPRAR